MLEAIQGYRAPERMSIEELNASGPFPAGAPNTAYARYFTGKSYLTAISTSQVPLFAVSFEPGCRNSWHVHRASRGGGQILVATAGRGYCQIWGEEPVELHPGDVVHIPATSGTGTARRPTRPSSILRWKCRARTRARRGWNPSPMPTTQGLPRAVLLPPAEPSPPAQGQGPGQLRLRSGRRPDRRGSLHLSAANPDAAPADKDCGSRLAAAIEEYRSKGFDHEQTRISDWSRGRNPIRPGRRPGAGGGCPSRRLAVAGVQL